MFLLPPCTSQEYEIDKTLGIKGPEDVAKMGIAEYNKQCRNIVMRYSNEWEVCLFWSLLYDHCTVLGIETSQLVSVVARDYLFVVPFCSEYLCLGLGERYQNGCFIQNIQNPDPSETQLTYDYFVPGVCNPYGAMD